MIRLQNSEHTSTIKIFIGFTTFFEKEVDDVNAFLVSLREHLLLLYSCGIKLESNLFLSDKEYEDVVTAETLELKIAYLEAKLSDDRFYWDIFNPVDEAENSKPVCGDLIEDITDIYKDIKNTLFIYSLGKIEDINSAMWQFEFQFKSHWGNHCIDALRICHYLIEKRKDTP